MTQARIDICYRNLLITLAKDAEDLKRDVTAMFSAVKTEQSNGRRNGIRTLINARNRQRARLLQLLNRNKAALHYFFQTTDAEKVATHKIKLSCTDS